MSKYLKDLLTRDLKNQLNGVGEALVVDVIGLDAIHTSKLRSELRKKNIKLEVVKNSLALRATEGTPLAKAFEGVEGTMAIVWGSDDFVSLTKEIVKLSEAKEFEGFKAKGGAMDGASLSPVEIKSISKWPSRLEQLSILVGQILGPGSKLAAQLGGAGGALVSQVKTHAENLEKSGGGDAPAAGGGDAPAAEAAAATT